MRTALRASGVIKGGVQRSAGLLVRRAGTPELGHGALHQPCLKTCVPLIFVSDDPVDAGPATSTRVFYMSVGVCCGVIFLVAIILAVLHLHSMKRIELDDRYCTCFGKQVTCMCTSAPHLPILAHWAGEEGE